MSSCSMLSVGFSEGLSVVESRETIFAVLASTGGAGVVGVTLASGVAGVAGAGGTGTGCASTGPGLATGSANAEMCERPMVERVKKAARASVRVLMLVL